MIELVRDLRVINVLAKFENDPWKIMDVRELTGLVCPAARSGDDNTPEPLSCGVKNLTAILSQGTSLPSLTPIREELCTHESGNRVVSPDGETDGQSDSSIPPFLLSWAGV